MYQCNFMKLQLGGYLAQEANRTVQCEDLSNRND